MQSNILIWSKDVGFIKINEGDGSNLDKSDVSMGYIDYIMMDFLDYDGYEFTETDGAQVMLTQLYQDKFHTVNEVIRHLIDCSWIPDDNYMCLYAK